MRILECTLGQFIAALRMSARPCGIYFPRMFWFLRFESGTRKDLYPHIHFVCAGLSGRVSPEQFSAMFVANWTKLGGGLAVVTPYDHSRDGVGYIVKRTTIDPELPCEVTFSEALLAWLARLI